MDRLELFRALSRFCRDRRGGTLVDYAMMAALLTSCRQVAMLHGTQIGHVVTGWMPI